MKIAIPTAQGALCMHFGHCELFAILTVDEAAKSITATQEVAPPPHEPGVLPRWLHEQGVELIIAGGMGMRAQQLFGQFGIRVIVGAPADRPEKVAGQWLAGELVTGDNCCSH
jgi:predicted Fe-Mo cluster-binding NifX family protein